MLDLENTDLSNGRVAGTNYMSVSRQQLKQLAEISLANSERDQARWFQEQTESRTRDILRQNSDPLLRLLRAIFNRSPKSEGEATKQAIEEIDRYPRFMTNWEATDCVVIARKWLAAANTLSEFSSFDVPEFEFNEMLFWATK